MNSWMSRSGQRSECVPLCYVWLGRSLRATGNRAHERVDTYPYWWPGTDSGSDTAALKDENEKLRLELEVSVGTHWLTTLLTALFTHTHLTTAPPFAATEGPDCINRAGSGRNNSQPCSACSY
jgi:hypothetical protein